MKSPKRLVAAALLALLAGLLPACGQENKVEDKRVITTPEGTTTIRDTTEVEKTGGHRSDE